MKWIAMLKDLFGMNWEYNSDRTLRQHTVTGKVQQYEYDDWGCHWVPSQLPFAD